MQTIADRQLAGKDEYSYALKEWSGSWTYIDGKTSINLNTIIQTCL